MALEYALIVVGRTSAEQMRARLDVPVSAPFSVTLHGGKHGYFESDDWALEPDKYLHVGFRAEKEADPQVLARNMIERALATGDEDMAFIQNGEVLVLERTGGEVRRLPVGFWNNVDT
jgi:hypothetical protein